MINCADCFYYYRKLLTLVEAKPYEKSIVEWYQENCRIYLDEYPINDVTIKNYLKIFQKKRKK